MFNWAALRRIVCLAFPFSSPSSPALIQKSSILENLRTQSLAWVRLGPYSVFLMSVRRIKVILQPQLADDAIAGNSSWPVQTSLTSHSKLLVTSKPDRSELSYFQQSLFRGCSVSIYINAFPCQYFFSFWGLLDVTSSVNDWCETHSLPLKISFCRVVLLL